MSPLPARGPACLAKAGVRDHPDVDRPEIQAALDDECDQAILFHGFADYMRDYEVFIYATADPCCGPAVREGTPDDRLCALALPLAARDPRRAGQPVAIPMWRSMPCPPCAGRSETPRHYLCCFRSPLHMPNRASAKTPPGPRIRPRRPSRPQARTDRPAQALSCRIWRVRQA